ncbi:hypothetical protein C8R47DRAFT_508313 [Mycena vitilis]|nr:hypothetical protein C8R47DRAFT_508313 [Mycena vitilis]
MSGTTRQPRMPLPPISIHTDFSPQFLQITSYMKTRAADPEFCSKSPGHAQIGDMIFKCLSARTCRIMVPTKQTLNGQPVKTLYYITVTGRHGLQMRISDFYSLLGFIISETDQYPSYTRIEGSPHTVRPNSDVELEAIHLSILAHYTKWIDILSKSGWFKDAAPKTTCIMYNRTPVLGSDRAIIPAAIFPNLSGVFKDEAVLLQQENMQGFLDGLRIMGVSPQQLKNLSVHFGHCAEVLALLYLLDPTAAVMCFLSGISAQTAPLRMMPSYDPAKFKSKLAPACPNCQYVVRAINDEMKKRGGSFQYTDRAVDPPRVIPQPFQRRCMTSSYKCENDPLRQFECPGCRLSWYCSTRCRDNDCHHLQFRKSGCRRCERCFACGSTSAEKLSSCSRCLNVPKRVAAMYCNTDCQAKHYPEHKSWCEDGRNKGLAPALVEM